MRNFTCWERSAVADTVFIDIGALPIALDPLFLAAHTPARVEHWEGPSTSTAAGGEEQIFDSLLADIGSHQSNSIIAVVGAPGTGKSHIVRWINAHLRRTKQPIHLLYVPREVSNLKDLLKSFADGLPGRLGADMYERVEHAIGGLTEAEAASRLTSAMADELRWRFPAPSNGAPNESDDARARREQRDRLLGTYDSEECRRRNGFADVLTAPYFRDHLEREGGTLRNVAASIVGRVQGGDSAVTKFEPEDLNPPGTTRDLMVRRFVSSIKYEPDVALRLLQEALEQALPTFVGLTASSGGETLESLFSESRLRLKERKEELVLLFEDLAQFGLIDGALFNQFLIQPDEEHAPLRAVFAITNAKWEERVPEAVQRRVRHRYEVLPIQEVAASVSQLQPIKRFLARYLNLVRLGKTRTLEAWDSAEATAQQDGSWIANACMTRNDGKECEFLSECHRGFGRAAVESIGDVGTYPFNEASLERLVRKLGTAAANPGRLLKSALEEVLVEARPHIQAGSYPDKRVEDLFDFEFDEGLEELRRGVAGDTGDRLLRTNVVWGDGKVLRDPDLLEAFDLPTDGAQLGGPPTDDRDQGHANAEDSADVTLTDADKLPPLPLLREINAWSQNPEGLTEAAIKQLRPWLYSAVVERVESDQEFVNQTHGAGKELLSSVIVTASFVFPGAGYGAEPGDKRLRFELKPNQRTVAILVALLWY